MTPLGGPQGRGEGVGPKVWDYVGELWRVGPDKVGPVDCDEPQRIGLKGWAP